MFYTRLLGVRMFMNRNALGYLYQVMGKRLENTSSTSEEKELGLVQSFPLAAQLLGRCFSFPCNHLFCAKFSRCFKREIIRYHFAMEHEERHPNTHSFSENVFLGRTLIIFDPIHAHFSCQLTILIFAKAGEVSLFSFSRTGRFLNRSMHTASQFKMKMVKILQNLWYL